MTEEILSLSLYYKVLNKKINQSSFNNLLILLLQELAKQKLETDLKELLLYSIKIKMVSLIFKNLKQLPDKFTIQLMMTIYYKWCTVLLLIIKHHQMKDFHSNNFTQLFLNSTSVNDIKLIYLCINYNN